MSRHLMSKKSKPSGNSYTSDQNEFDHLPHENEYSLQQDVPSPDNLSIFQIGAGVYEAAKSAIDNLVLHDVLSDLCISIAPELLAPADMGGPHPLLEGQHPGASSIDYSNLNHPGGINITNIVTDMSMIGETQSHQAQRETQRHEHQGQPSNDPDEGSTAWTYEKWNDSDDTHDQPRNSVNMERWQHSASSSEPWVPRFAIPPFSPSLHPQYRRSECCNVASEEYNPQTAGHVVGRHRSTGRCIGFRP